MIFGCTAEALAAYDKTIKRTYPIATGNSVAAGDVVDVVNGEVTRSVVAEANVKNVVLNNNSGNLDICRLNDEYSVVAISAPSNSMLYACLVKNSTGELVNRTMVHNESNSIYIKIRRLNDTNFIIGSTSSDYLYINAGSLSGNALSIGAKYSVAAGISLGAYTFEALSSDQFVILFDDATNVVGEVYSVSGTTISRIKRTTLERTQGIRSMNSTLLPKDGSGNKRVCVGFMDGNDGNKIKAVIATINSSNAVTWGSMEAVISSIPTTIFFASNGNTVVALYGASAMVLTVNGTSITTGNQIQLEGAKFGQGSCVICVGRKFVVCGYGNTSSGSQNGSYTIVLNVSGLNITANTAYKFDPASAFYLRACPISDNKLIIAYADNGNNNYGTSTILEVNGNQIAGGFTVNSTQAIALESGEAGQEIEVIFAGTTAADFVAEGQKIPSDGVYGYGPMAGWLNVIPHWAKEAGVKIATGSYVGTGKKGNLDPNSLTFNFLPKFLMFIIDDKTSIFVIYNVTGKFVVAPDGQYYCTITYSGNTISWYVNNSTSSNCYESYQLNAANTTYYYLAIG